MTTGPRPLQNYVRSPMPALQESQKIWLENELKKIERVTDSIYENIKELQATVASLDARVTALEP